MKTIHVSTDLPTDAETVWSAMQHPASFLYVTRGLLGVPMLEGRTEPVRAGESGTGWIWLFGLIPFSRHTIHIADVDAETMTIRSREHGGLLRAWNHDLHVEPVGEDRCRYSDTVEIDAGVLTDVVAAIGVGLYRYRQRRWRMLVDRHLLPSGPRYRTVRLSDARRAARPCRSGGW